MAQYVVLIYEDENAWDNSPEMWDQVMKAHGRFSRAGGRARRHHPRREALQPTATATTIRADVVTDGPFVESKEALGGFYLIEAARPRPRHRDRPVVPGRRRWRRGAPRARHVLRSRAGVSPPDEVRSGPRRGAPSRVGPRARRDGAPGRRPGPGEECAQDAFVAALQTWAARRHPAHPGAWLTTAARRKVLDAHRRAGALRGRLPLLVEPYAEQDLAADAMARGHGGDPRRPAAAGVHLLSPGAGPGGPGRRSRCAWSAA